MEMKINITELIEKHEKQELSFYMNRGTAAYKSLCELLDYAFSEDTDAFIYYTRILLSRFNNDDKSGGFMDSDKKVMEDAIKFDPCLASEIIACNREQRKMLSKYPYGYMYAELLRLTIYSQFEKQKKTCNITMPEFIYFDYKKKGLVPLDDLSFSIKNKCLKIVREK